MLTQGASYGKKEVWAKKVLLLSLCLMKKEGEGEELALMRYMDWLLLLDKVHEALRFVCLPWATASSAEKKHDVGEGDEGRCCGGR